MKTLFKRFLRREIGFTLVELAIAMLVVGVLSTIAVPAVINSAAMAIVLVISGFWSAPAHGKLADGFDKSVHDQLMTVNLIRTLAWTVCGACSIWIMFSTWAADRAE